MTKELEQNLRERMLKAFGGEFYVSVDNEYDGYIHVRVGTDHASGEQAEFVEKAIRAALSASTPGVSEEQVREQCASLLESYAKEPAWIPEVPALEIAKRMRSGHTERSKPIKITAPKEAPFLAEVLTEVKEESETWPNWLKNTALLTGVAEKVPPATPAAEGAPLERGLLVYPYGGTCDYCGEAVYANSGHYCKASAPPAEPAGGDVERANKVWAKWHELPFELKTVVELLAAEFAAIRREAEQAAFEKAAQSRASWRLVNELEREIVRLNEELTHVWREHTMYMEAWCREIGGFIRRKHWQIDGYVLRTRDALEEAEKRGHERALAQSSQPASEKEE
jgi:hypothetical protein